MGFFGPYQVYKIENPELVARVADWDKLNVSVNNAVALAEGNAKAYADTKDTGNRSAWAAADTAKLAEAKAYADTKDTSNRSAWAAADTAKLAEAKAYTDQEVASDRGRLTAVETKNAAQDTSIAEHNQRAGEVSTLLGMVPLVYGRDLIPLTALTPDANAKGLWHFDSSLVDSSGNGRNLAQTAGTTVGSYSSDARFGSRSLNPGVYENASADLFISATGANGGAYTKFTAEAWVKTSKHTGTKVVMGHNRWFWLGITSGGVATADIGDGVNSVRLTGTSVIAPALLTDATWHHIALVLDISTGGSVYVGLFVDGKCEHVLPFDGRITGSDPAAPKFAVGGLGSTVRSFDWALSPGYVDEVRLSDTARYKNRVGAYPPRPKGLPGGYAEYIGTATPGDKLPFDKWIKVATS